MNRDVVIAEWRRSTETLAAADLLVREDYAGAGISTAYYAVLHAAKAALFATADYDVGVFFTSEDGSHSRQRARTFVERIRLYLLTKGLTEDDLAS